MRPYTKKKGRLMTEVLSQLIYALLIIAVMYIMYKAGNDTK